MRPRTALGAPVILVLCVACGGGNNSVDKPGNNPPTDAPKPAPAPTYTLGGTVRGLRGSGLTLQNGNTHLPLTSDGAFTFPDMLSSGASYSVSVQTQPANPTQACTVAYGSGTVGAANVTNVTVTCVIAEVSRNWQTATQIQQTGAAEEENARLAINAHGTAALVWRQRDVNDAVQIWASRYVPEQKQWSTPTHLQGQAGATFPEVAITESGEMVAAWSELANGHYEVFASRYTDSGGWSAAVRVDSGTVLAAEARVAYDPAGNAMAFWEQLDGAGYHIYLSRLDVGAATWSAPLQLDTSAGMAENPYLVADAHGNLVVTWAQTDSVQAGAVSHIWSSIYNSHAGTWGVPAQVGNDSTSPVVYSNLVGNIDGIAEALWQQLDGSIWSNQYSPEAGWGTAKLLEAGGNGNSIPQMAIDPNGNVLALWERTDLTDHDSHLRYAALPAGGSWSASALVSPVDAGDHESTDGPQIAFDAHGEALAVWVRAEGGHANGRSAVYTPGAGWSAPVDIGSTGNVLEPALAVAPDGNAVAAWQQDLNGVSGLWSNLFD